MKELKPNLYCHTALGVSNYLSEDPDWYKDWWNYITSLRGCDVDDRRCEALKGLLTCVLRGKEIPCRNDDNVAWGITFAMERDGYFNVFDDTPDQTELIEFVSRDEFQHYRHHLAMGFDALSFYYKRLYDQSGDDIHFLCGEITQRIYDDLTVFNSDVNDTLFDDVLRFLRLIGDEVDIKDDECSNDMEEWLKSHGDNQ